MLILLLEDDLDTREVLSEVLTDEGHVVESFEEPVGAFTRLMRGPTPGLVFLDLVLDGMTGLDFRKKMLKVPALATIPVVLLTGSSDAEGIARSVKAHGALRKPVSVASLRDCVARYERPEPPPE